MRRQVIALLVIGAILLGLSTVLGSWYTVEEGQRGVLLRTGNVIAVADPGLHFKLPYFDAVVPLSVRTEKRRYEQVNSYSKDIQPSDSIITVNYRLMPTHVAEVFSQYGANWVERVLDPILMERTKENFGQFVASDIVTQRQRLGVQIEEAVRQAMPAGIQIDGIQIENIDFSDAYEQAIEQAMQAEAEVRKVRNQLEREKVTAETRVVQAKAEADAVRERAKADAEAIRLRGEAEAAAIDARGRALKANPELIGLVSAEKWDGKLPTTQVPGAAVPFLQLPAGQGG